MKVHPGQHEEYRRRHNPIWKELEHVLVSHGVRAYSIHLDPATGDLFAVADIESEERWEAIASTDVCRRWWTYMNDIMRTHPDHSPVAEPLVEVFRLHA